MIKTAEEIANDILSALNKKEAPERHLLVPYLEVVIKRHRDEAVNEYIESLKNKEPKDYKSGL